jgi:hypothetical protein
MALREVATLSAAFQNGNGGGMSRASPISPLLTVTSCLLRCIFGLQAQYIRHLATTIAGCQTLSEMTT